MNEIKKIFFGFNLISLRHLLHGKPLQFLAATKSAYIAAHAGTSFELTLIPELSLYEILAHREPIIRLCMMQYEDGSLPNEQAMVLLSILVAESPDVVLEIGTYMGHTTRQMAENLPNAIIHTVDLPESFSMENDDKSPLPMDDFHLIKSRVVGRKFRGLTCANRIIQHFVDTASWNFCLSGSPTFFFIDGSHTYEYCKNDSEKCFSLCDGHGIFLWHDCDTGHPGVVKLIREWRGQGRNIYRISGTPFAYWKNI